VSIDVRGIRNGKTHTTDIHQRGANLDTKGGVLQHLARIDRVSWVGRHLDDLVSAM
jgi:hypothetical protein